MRRERGLLSQVRLCASSTLLGMHVHAATCTDAGPGQASAARPSRRRRQRQRQAGDAAATGSGCRARRRHQVDLHLARRVVGTTNDERRTRRTHTPMISATCTNTLAAAAANGGARRRSTVVRARACSGVPVVDDAELLGQRAHQSSPKPRETSERASARRTDEGAPPGGYAHASATCVGGVVESGVVADGYEVAAETCASPCV